MTAQASIPGERDHPSLALVNSRHNSRTGMVDHLSGPQALGEWLAWRSLLDGPVAAGDRDLDRALALRGAVRELLVAAVEGRAPEPSAVAAVNHAAAMAPAAHQVRWDADGDPVRTRSAPAATEVERALAAIAEDAIALVCDHRADLIACEAPGCVRLLLKDHPRRHWCSTRCGDRVRAARHYRRSRESSGERT